MDQQSPIGIFDSGVGGTSIWREIHHLMPSEDTIYLADSRNAPYGEKAKSEIIELSRKNTRLLVELGCKIIVVACNTATTNAIRELRAEFDVPFIGIEPAIKPAALHSKTQTIGILATKGTLSSELFNRAVDAYQDTTIIEQIGHGLVQLIENGEKDSPKTKILLRQYLEPMIAQGIDYHVLGCSHYPYLIPAIREIIPAHVKIIDSGEAVARRTQILLSQKDALAVRAKGSNIFYSNGNPKVLESLVGNTYSISYREF